MSTARVDLNATIAPQLATVANVHAERIDDLADDQRIHGDRIEALEMRVAKLEPTVLASPDPASWGERMRERLRELLGTDDLGPSLYRLIGEAHLAMTAMKPGWRPMPTAPRDGRLVLLRWAKVRIDVTSDGKTKEGVARRRPDYVAGKFSGAHWLMANGFSPGTVVDWNFDGWLPIPGEGDA